MCVKVFLLSFPTLVFLVSQSWALDSVVLGAQINSRLTVKGLPVIECTFKKMGVELRVDRVPWARAQVGTKEGVYDGFFMASKNSRRDAYAIFSRPFMKVKWVYVTRRKDNLKKSDIDFFKKTFAANAGTARLHWLNKKFKNRDITNEIVTAETTLQMLKMLFLNRMDIVLENVINIKKIVAEGEINMKNLKIFPAREKSLALYFSHAFIKKHPNFLKTYNATILGCKES